jgi:hypothetical protein
MAKKSTTRKRSSRVSGKTSNVERVACNESLEASKGKAFDTPVDLLVISYRVRLADPDGISGKAAIDGCVHRGILRDDNAKWIREVRYQQVKVKDQTEEKTLLIFTPIEEAK